MLSTFLFRDIKQPDIDKLQNCLNGDSEYIHRNKANMW